MILEGLVTSRAPDGTPHLAPMGPRVTPMLDHLVLRPFKTSQTYRNLRAHPEGVFHVTDDVLLLARAAIGRLEQLPPLIPATRIQGWVLADACRFFEFRIQSVDDLDERATLHAVTVCRGSQRDFFGLNRAKHAVVEAAILATRIHLLPSTEIAAEFARLRVLVDKTGGDQEREAFTLLTSYLQERNGSLSA